MKDAIDQAAQAVRCGKTVIYPTETFFALGGLGMDANVVDMIMKIKGRPDHKPLPLVAGSVLQCQEVAELEPMALILAGQFWPGPLSVLVRAADHVPRGVKDSGGMVSIRVTPHPDAAKLCLLSGMPLIATSANFSGQPSCALFHDLDKSLKSMVGYALDSACRPAGGLPSTLVRITGTRSLKIIRPGKVSAREMIHRGWKIQS